MARHHHNKTCLNCGNVFSGKYCNECGQKAEVERITPTYLINEAIHGITHYEKGFLHTIIDYLVRPGTASLKFLQGKRREYQKPVGYILILTGIYIILHNFIIDRFHYSYDVDNSKIIIDKANIFLRSHFTPIIFLIIILSAVIIYLILAVGKFNFTETLTLCLYGGGTYFLMLAVSDVLLGAIFGVNIISVNVFIYQTILSSVYNLWFSYDIFKKAKVHYLWPKLIASAFIISVMGYSIMMYLPMMFVS